MVDVRVHAAVRDEPHEVDVLAALERGAQDLVVEELAALDRLVHAHEVLEEDPAGADGEVADLGVAHLAGRQADRLARRLQRRVRVALPQPVEDRRVRELDRVPRAGRGDAPAVEDDEDYEGIRSAIRHSASKDATSSDAPPTSAPSTSGCAEQPFGVVGLHRAAVEDGCVEQGLDERVRVLRHLRRRGEPGADRPHRLVREHEVRVRLEHGQLAAEDVLGLAALALGLQLADARDDLQPGVERGARPLRDRLVRLAEVLPPLGVADERAGDAELEQHRAPRSRPCRRPRLPSARSARTS